MKMSKVMQSLPAIEPDSSQNSIDLHLFEDQKRTFTHRSTCVILIRPTAQLAKQSENPAGMQHSDLGRENVIKRSTSSIPWVAISFRNTALGTPPDPGLRPFFDSFGSSPPSET